MKYRYTLDELITDDNFNEQYDTDEYYKSHKVMPYIRLDFKCDINTKEEMVTKITIIFAKTYTDKAILLKYKPCQLFSSSLWERVWKDSTDNYLINKTFRYESILRSIVLRKEHTNQSPYDPIYTDSLFLNCIENIWKKYRLSELLTTIDRYAFRLWPYRLWAVMLDLIEYPYHKDTNWLKRQEIIKYLASDELGEKFECYNKDVWQKSINKEILSPEIAFKNRVEDARKLLNDFYKSEIADWPTTAIEDFVISFYDSFGQELIVHNWLMKCEFCNQFIPFVKGKKFCSLKTEGRDCGKSARNKRYYATTGQKRLPKYRKTTKELRAFYKEKGIKK